MLKYYSAILILLLFLGSCSYFENKAKTEPVQEVDTLVDFNTVDAFPLFPNCADIPSREKQQICFQVEMSQHIYAFLKKYEFDADEQITDTVMVTLRINASGKTSLEKIDISEITQKLLPEFDSLVRVSISKLPILQPAIKRALPVTTEFILPIILTN